MIIMLLIILIILTVIFWAISTLIALRGGIHYVGSGKDNFRSAFKLVKLNNRQIMYELGSGYGDGLLVAAKEFGAETIGIEISPFHYLVSKWRTRKIPKIKVILGNYNNVVFKRADVVYCYLLPKMLDALLPKLKKELHHDSTVISKTFKFTNISPSETKDVNNEKFYFYKF